MGRVLVICLCMRLLIDWVGVDMEVWGDLSHQSELVAYDQKKPWSFRGWNSFHEFIIPTGAGGVGYCISIEAFSGQVVRIYLALVLGLVHGG